MPITIMRTSLSITRRARLARGDRIGETTRSNRTWRSPPARRATCSGMAIRGTVPLKIACTGMGSIVINRITRWDAEGYEEVEAARILPDWVPESNAPIRSTHATAS